MKVRSTSYFVLVVLFLFVGGPLPAKELPVDARLDEVTVYQGTAETVRRASAALPAGATTIVFRDVPASTRPDSLRVRIVDGSARVGMVELRRRVDEPDGYETARLETTIDEHRDALAAIDASSTVDTALRDYLERVLEAGSTLEGARLIEGRGDPQAISAVYELARRELTTLVDAELARRPERRELDAALDRDTSRLDELVREGFSEHHDVLVELELERAGAIEIALTAEVTGASWQPAYRAELHADGQKVRFITEGVVRQSTGEDWDGVSLRLSSAAPTRKLAQPKIGSTWLAVNRGGSYQSHLRLGRGILDPDGDGSPTVHGSRSRDFETQARGVHGTDPLTGRWMSRVNPHSIEEMEVITSGAGVEFDRAQGGYAEIIQQPGSAGYTVTFAVPGDAQLAGDGSARRVTLREDELDGSPVYRTVPSLDPRAYLVFNAMSPDEYPLLSGPLRVYVDGAFVGSGRLRETGPGAKLPLPFGVDNRIELTHVPSGLDGDAGWTGKQRVRARSSRTLIRNLHERAVTLIVEDRIPVARDERIDVRLANETTPGHTPSDHRPGVMLWELELEPGDRRDLVLDYEIRHPTELALQASR